MNVDKLIKLRAYLDKLIAANSAIEETQPEPPPAFDLVAWKTSIRNRVLANDGLAAELIGTLSSNPSVSQSDLEALGLGAAQAAALIGARDALRAQALAIKP